MTGEASGSSLPTGDSSHPKAATPATTGTSSDAGAGSSDPGPSQLPTGSLSMEAPKSPLDDAWMSELDDEFLAAMKPTQADLETRELHKELRQWQKELPVKLAALEKAVSKNVDKQIDGLGQKLMSFLEAGLGRVGGGDKPSTRQPSLTSEREPAEEGDAVRPDVFTFPPVRPFSRVNPYWTDKLPRFLGAGQSFHVWQFKAEKLLRSMEVPYENWAALAAFSLEGQPLDYWMAYEKTLPPQSAITWPQFLDKLTPVFSSDMECFTAARKWESMSCSGRPTAEQIVAFLTDCMACYEAMSPKTRPPEEVAFKEVVEKLPFSLKMLILHDKVLRPQLYDKSLTDSLMTVAGMTRSLVLTLGDNGLTAEPSHKGSHPQLPSKSAQEANPRPSKRQKTVAAPGESGALQIVKSATKAAGAVGKVGDTQGLAYRGPGEEARHPGLSWDRRIMRVTLDDHLCPYCLKTGHRLTTCRLLTDQEDRRRAIIAATFVSRSANPAAGGGQGNGNRASQDKGKGKAKAE